MVIFDHAWAWRVSNHENEPVEDYVLVYYAVSCLYLTLKVESRLWEPPFNQFLKDCTHLDSFNSLHLHVAPHLDQAQWTNDLYKLLEQEILE